MNMKHFQDINLTNFSCTKEQKGVFSRARRPCGYFCGTRNAYFRVFSALKLQGPVGVRPVVHGGKVRHCVRVLALPVTVEHTVQVTLAHL